MYCFNGRTLFGLWAALLLLWGCSSYRQTGGEPNNEALETQASATIDNFKAVDATLNRFFESSASYAVFPNIAQGGAGVGAAQGEGVVYQNGKAIGYVTMTQGSLGAQLGGQAYSQLVFFENDAELKRLQQDRLAFLAEASAVAASKGAGAKADYADGVAVFVANQEGLMFNASIGGQKFKYRSKAAGG